MDVSVSYCADACYISFHHAYQAQAYNCEALTMQGPYCSSDQHADVSHQSCFSFALKSSNWTLFDATPASTMQGFSHFVLFAFEQELEHREKQYDGREHLDIYTNDDDEEPALCNVLTFVATSKNVNWLGPASMESIAQQIAASTGPSGPNYEYLEQLAKALWKVWDSLHPLFFFISHRSGFTCFDCRLCTLCLDQTHGTCLACSDHLLMYRASAWSELCSAAAAHESATSMDMVDKLYAYSGTLLKSAVCMLDVFTYSAQSFAWQWLLRLQSVCTVSSSEGLRACCRLAG